MAGRTLAYILAAHHLESAKGGEAPVPYLARIMSSLMGHSLAGVMVSLANRCAAFPTATRMRWLWVGWLVFVAIAPDLDYVVPFLYPSAHAGLRVTHSLLFACLLPPLTLICLRIYGVKRRALLSAALQLTLASGSHIALDTLVGVTALPLVWPASDYVFKLPFGVLPSAGRPSLSNYYFYYNLGIEMGVLMPLSCCVLISQFRKKSVLVWAIVGLLLSVAAYFMHWAYGLSR